MQLIAKTLGALIVWTVVQAAAVAAPACPSVEKGEILLGYTLTHTAVDTGAEARCRTETSGVASIDGSNSIVSRYDDPMVRERVGVLWHQMKSSGASVLRTIIWFRHAEDEAMARRARDPLGLLVASDGRFAEADVDNIEHYVRDAGRAGYRRLVLVLGVQGTANPKCRKHGTWGACYDKGFDARSWSAVEQVISRLTRADLAGIEVLYDIAPTSCAPPSSRQRVDAQMNAYARYMVSQFKRVFGEGRFITSCGGVDDRRAAQALRARAAMFDEIGVRPAAIDLHVYETARSDVDALARLADAEARRLGVELIIAETFFDHPNLFELVKSRQSKLPALSSLLVFPKLTGSACQFSVAPPYRLEPIAAEVGPVAKACKSQ